MKKEKPMMKGVRSSRMHDEHSDDPAVRDRIEAEHVADLKKRWRSPAQKEAKASQSEDAEDAEDEEEQEFDKENAGQGEEKPYDSRGERDAGKSKVEHGFAVPEDQHPALADLKAGDSAVIEAEVIAAIETEGTGRQIAFKIRDVRAG